MSFIFNDSLGSFPRLSYILVALAVSDGGPPLGPRLRRPSLRRTRFWTNEPGMSMKTKD